MKLFHLNSSQFLLRTFGPFRSEVVEVSTGKVSSLPVEQLLKEGTELPLPFLPIGEWKPFSSRTLLDLQLLRQRRLEVAFHPGPSKRKKPTDQELPKKMKRKKSSSPPLEVLIALRKMPLPMREMMAKVGNYTLPPELSK